MALKQDIGSSCNNCSGCRGFKIHGWRKNCLDCYCSVETHDISDESTLPILDEMKLFDKPFYTSYQEALTTAAKGGKLWIPIGLKLNEIDCVSAAVSMMFEKNHGEKMRKKMMRWQIPVQDRCVEKFCHLDTAIERQEAEKFLVNRNTRELGIGYVLRLADDNVTCVDCQTSIKVNNFAVTNDSNSVAKQYWHPQCFKCTTCHEILVDYIHATHNNKVYCVRHYATNIRPRCGACDELIFSTEFIRANEEDFHMNHFACAMCDSSLAKQRFVLQDNRSICSSCYNLKFANKCIKCQTTINCECQDISHKSYHWHQDCFSCSHCSQKLDGQQFAFVSDQLFCDKCHRDKMLPKCQKCNNHVECGKKIICIDDKNWHYECFTCDECKKPIGNENFSKQDGKSICWKCYESKYTKKCSKCMKPIVEGGVLYRSSSYHHDCFQCKNCNSKIIDTKFIFRDNYCYCKSCADKLFSTLCNKCNQMINVEMGSKYIKFEERTWHTDCFNCSKCNSSLVDKGFLTKDNDIFCSSCLS